jgi:hypothetical protein
VELENHMKIRKGVKPVGELAKIYQQIKDKVLAEHEVADWAELGYKIGHKPETLRGNKLSKYKRPIDTRPNGEIGKLHRDLDEL